MKNGMKLLLITSKLLIDHMLNMRQQICLLGHGEKSVKAWLLLKKCMLVNQ